MGIPNRRRHIRHAAIELHILFYFIANIYGGVQKFGDIMLTNKGNWTAGTTCTMCGTTPSESASKSTPRSATSCSQARWHFAPRRGQNVNEAVGGPSRGPLRRAVERAAPSHFSRTIRREARCAGAPPLASAALRCAPHLLRFLCTQTRSAPLLPPHSAHSRLRRKRKPRSAPCARVAATRAR